MKKTVFNILFLCLIFILAQALLLTAEVYSNAIGINIESYQKISSNNLTSTDMLEYLMNQYREFPEEWLELRTYFEEILYLDYGSNRTVGLFYIREDNINANQESVNLYLDFREGVIAEGTYELDAVTNNFELNGFFLGRELINTEAKNNNNPGLAVNSRLKLIYDGELDNRIYRGDITVRRPLVYQGGYRKIEISRDRESKARGLSLDLFLKLNIDKDTDLFLNAYNIFDYVVFNDVYRREIYGRRGFFKEEDMRISISDRVETGVKYKNWQVNFDFHHRFYSGISYKFKLGDYSIQPGLYGNSYSFKLSSNLFEIDLKSDRLNPVAASNLSFSINIGYNF